MVCSGNLRNVRYNFLCWPTRLASWRVRQYKVCKAGSCCGYNVLKLANYLTNNTVDSWVGSCKDYYSGYWVQTNQGANVAPGIGLVRTNHLPS